MMKTPIDLGADLSTERSLLLGALLQETVPRLVKFVGNADSERRQHLQGIVSNSTEKETSLIDPTTTSRESLEDALGNLLSTDDVGSGIEGYKGLIDMILKHSINTSAPGFLDKLYAAPLPPGIVAELILGVLNTNLHVYQVSPVLTLIEKHVGRSLAHMFGLTGSRSGGISVQGGSASNMTSIVVARNVLFPETKLHGNSAVQGQLLLYTSAHGHYSIEKAAQALGLGSRSVISVPVDAHGRMIPQQLSQMIEEDCKMGKVPFFINATAGTTVLGSFDDFEEIARVARKHKIWLHVDAAWGGGFVFSGKKDIKEKLCGINLADSIATNPHKMLGIPVTCSFLLGKDMKQFEQANTLKAGYLFHGDDDELVDVHHTQSDGEKTESKDTMKRNVNGDGEAARWTEPYDLADLTLQCGRRGDSIKFFLSWKFYGSDGYARMVDNAYDVACDMARLIEKHPDLTPVLAASTPSCLQLCFYFTPRGKFVYGPINQSGHLVALLGDLNRSMMEGQMRMKRRDHLGKANSLVTRRIAKALIPLGFMIDFAPALEGQQDKGSFFRVVVNISTSFETVERLVREISSVGNSIVAELQKYGGEGRSQRNLEF